MHLHNPGIWAVGGTEQFVLTGNALVLFTSGLLLPKKTLKQAKKCLIFCQPWCMQRILESCSSQGCCWLRCQILDAFPTHINRTLIFLHQVYPGNLPKKKNELCSPHSELIEAAKSNTQRKEKKSFRASVSILSCSVCTDWSTAIALLIPQQGWTSKQSKTASFTAVGETLMDEGKPERRDNFVGKRIWILSWKMDSTQWFPLSKSNLLKPNLFQVITNSVAPLQGHKTISVLIWGTARHWQR